MSLHLSTAQLVLAAVVVAIWTVAALAAVGALCVLAAALKSTRLPSPVEPQPADAPLYVPTSWEVYL